MLRKGKKKENISLIDDKLYRTVCVLQIPKTKIRLIMETIKLRDSSKVGFMIQGKNPMCFHLIGALKGWKP